MLIFEVPWPPRILWPNGRGHHMTRYRYQQQANHDGYYAARAAMVPTLVAGRNGQPLKLTLTAHPPPRTRTFDDDGLIGAFKHYRDGIAKAMGINDGQFRVQPVEWGESRPRGCVKVTIGE